MQEQKTLADLKPGDKVAEFYGYSTPTIEEIQTVSRGIITLRGYSQKKYRVSNGSAVKSTLHNYSHIEPVTDEIMETIQSREIASKLNAVHINEWQKFSLEALKSINSIVEKERGRL